VSEPAVPTLTVPSLPVCVAIVELLLGCFYVTDSSNISD
jgi:hypothetical protein